MALTLTLKIWERGSGDNKEIILPLLPNLGEGGRGDEGFANN